MELVREAPADAAPMSTLRTATSALGLLDPDAEEMSPEANWRKAARLTAQLTTITAAIERCRRGEDPVPPDLALGHAANFLFMYRGERASEAAARAMDVALVLHADHGFNASTFSGRVTAATLSDMHSAVTSAIGTLKGPLHGGANQRVKEMLEEIGSPGRAADYVDSKLAAKQRIMGFGHRVYRVEDPRAKHLREWAETLSAEGDPAMLEIQKLLVEPDAGAQGPERQRRLLLGEPLRLPGPAGRPLPAALRNQPDLGLDDPHHGAVRRQHAHPAPLRIHRPRHAALSADGRPVDS